MGCMVFWCFGGEGGVWLGPCSCLVAAPPHKPEPRPFIQPHNPPSQGGPRRRGAAAARGVQQQGGGEPGGDGPGQASEDRGGAQGQGGEGGGQGVQEPVCVCSGLGDWGRGVGGIDRFPGLCVCFSNCPPPTLHTTKQTPPQNEPRAGGEPPISWFMCMFFQLPPTNPAHNQTNPTA